LQVPLSDVSGTLGENGQSAGCVVGTHGEMELCVVGVLVILLNCVICVFMLSDECRRSQHQNRPSVPRETLHCHANVYYAGRPSMCRAQCVSNSNKCIAVRKVATPLRELTCHMGSHGVTCHPAEVTFPPLPRVRQCVAQVHLQELIPVAVLSSGVCLCV